MTVLTAPSRVMAITWSPAVGPLFDPAQPDGGGVLGLGGVFDAEADLGRVLPLGGRADHDENERHLLEIGRLGKTFK